MEFFAANVAKFAKKDVNAYRDLKELEDVAKEVGERLSSKQQRAVLKGNVAKLFEDGDVLLVRPDDKSACVAYGKGTKWCITMANASYYEEYTGANAVFHFLIRKALRGDDLDKVAVATVRDAQNRVKGVEFYDAADGKILRNDVERAFSKELVDLALADAAKRPKSMLAKLSFGDPVPSDELVAYWRSLGDDRVAKIGILAMAAKSDGWREKYADTLLSTERDPSLRAALEEKAHVRLNGIEWVNVRGQRHREDGPAIEQADGLRSWWIRDERHREDGPAIEYADGTRAWWIRGQRHREDGPAFESASGIRAWWVHGQRHREDGPAVEYPDGSREWWWRGKQFKSEKEWKEMFQISKRVEKR